MQTNKILTKYNAIFLFISTDPATGDNFTCSCAPGYIGLYCALAFCESTPCVNGICDTQTQPPVCQCQAGYEGVLCDKDIDECGTEPCLNGGLCQDLLADFSCDCRETGENYFDFFLLLFHILLIFLYFFY
jgi:hypothetical protein